MNTPKSKMNQKTEEKGENNKSKKSEEEKLYSCLFISDEGISKLNMNLRTLPTLKFKNKFIECPNKNLKNVVKSPSITQKNKLEESFLSSNSQDESFDSSISMENEECAINAQIDSREERKQRICSVYQKFGSKRQNSYEFEEESLKFGEDSEMVKCTNKTVRGSQKTQQKGGRKFLFLSQSSYDKAKIEKKNQFEGARPVGERRKKFRSSD